jgi:NAD(P)H-flavin reductase
MKGITSKLASLALQTPNISIPITLDGPYSGLTISTFAKLDSVLLIAGGSGTGFMLPLVEDILRHQHGNNDDIFQRKTKIHVVIATRSQELKVWFQKEIENLRRYTSSSSEEQETSDILTSSIYVTTTSPTTIILSPYHCSADLIFDIEKTVFPRLSTPTCEGRPGLKVLVESITSTPGEAVDIAVCGPANMCYDVKNAAAEAQSRILRGVGAREVYLQSEAFG